MGQNTPPTHPTHPTHPTQRYLFLALCLPLTLSILLSLCRVSCVSLDLLRLTRTPRDVVALDGRRLRKRSLARQRAVPLPILPFQRLLIVEIARRGGDFHPRRARLSCRRRRGAGERPMADKCRQTPSRTEQRRGGAPDKGGGDASSRRYQKDKRVKPRDVVGMGWGGGWCGLLTGPSETVRTNLTHHEEEG